MAEVRAIEISDASHRPPVPSNPSERRSGIAIEGWCENCHGRWLLTLAQHKGQTEIDLTWIPPAA